MKRKRSNKMAEWLRWLRLHGACREGVAFVRQFASPQKAWEGLVQDGKCGWMVWLWREAEFGEHSGYYKQGYPEVWGHPEGPVAYSHSLGCARSILRRYPKVPDWKKGA